MKNKFLTVFLRTLALALGLFTLLPLLAAGAEDDVISENYAYNKDVTVSGSYSATPGSYITDGDDFSFSRTLSSHTASSYYAIVKFDEEVEINLIRFLPYLPERMGTVKLQYTTEATPSNKSQWTDIEVLASEELEAVNHIDFEPVKATGIRFLAEAKQHYLGLYEIGAYYAYDVAKGIDKLKNPPAPDFKEFTQAESVDAKIVSVGENGELIYADHDGNGATLIDYSYVGYKRGEADIPDVKVVKTLEAGDLTDHTAIIKDAINEVSALPEDQRGAILLKAGKYTITSRLTIKASGVVLRGEGQGEDGTIIYDAIPKSGTTLSIKGSGRFTSIPDTKRNLADDHIPSGETVIKLDSADVFSAGDQVRITCTPGDLWIQTLGMDKISGTDKEPWEASDYVMTYERVVTAVDTAANTVTVDTGIPLTLDSKYFTVYVQRIEDASGRISNSGVENIRFLSYYNGDPEDEKHGWNAVQFTNCRDCWARDITAKHYGYSTASVLGGAINVTVERCSYLEPISLIQGSRRYSFCINGGQYTLVKDCYSQESRHDFVVQARVAGPNVFVNCVAEDSYGVSEPHHRWSTGTLYDNVYNIGRLRLGYFEVVNRGVEGTGHGWAGAQTVFWNCLSPAVAVGKPQTEQNYAVGIFGNYNLKDISGYTSVLRGKFIKPGIVTPGYPSNKAYEGSPLYGNAYIEAPYNPVNPSSLYYAQLSYRLHGDATKSAAPCSPILEYPATDSKLETRKVTFSGICDVNADKVYVYVDGVQHRAEIADNDKNEFTLELALENGYHSVCVSQEALGLESATNAIRSIYVESNEPMEPEDTADTDANEPTTEPTPQPTPDPKKSNAGVIAAVAAVSAVAVAGIAAAVVIKKKKK